MNHEWIQDLMLYLIFLRKYLSLVSTMVRMSSMIWLLVVNYFLLALSSISANLALMESPIGIPRSLYNISLYKQKIYHQIIASFPQHILHVFNFCEQFGCFLISFNLFNYFLHVNIIKKALYIKTYKTKTTV